LQLPFEKHLVARTRVSGVNQLVAAKAYERKPFTILDLNRRTFEGNVVDNES